MSDVYRRGWPARGSQVRAIDSEDVGLHYVHCGQCIEEMPISQSPKEWARLSVSFTEIGLQIWCVRHESNVMHIDFEGQRHPANTRRQEP